MDILTIKNVKNAYIMIEDDIKSIEKENWRKAKGVKYRRGCTNSALTQRDYSIPCNTKKICVIKGYFIWWCSNHHQPLSICREDILGIKLDILKESFGKVVVENIFVEGRNND